jgi:hypothetical protein
MARRAEVQLAQRCTEPGIPEKFCPVFTRTGLAGARTGPGSAELNSAGWHSPGWTRIREGRSFR